jgi:hypothetical protein
VRCCKCVSLSFYGFRCSILSLGSFSNVSLKNNAELRFVQQICVHMLRLARVASSPVFIIVSAPWCFHVTARQAPCPHHCTSTSSLYTHFNITHPKPSASRHVAPRRITTNPHNVQSCPEQRRRRVMRQRHNAREANAREASEVCDLFLRQAIDLLLTLSAGTTSLRFSAFSSAPNHNPSDLLYGRQPAANACTRLVYA